MTSPPARNWTKDAKAVSISRAAPLGFGQTAQFELCDAGRSLWGMFAWLRCGHHTQKSEGKPVVLGMRSSNPFRNVALLKNLNDCLKI